MWQRVLSPNLGEIDPEHEQELRLVAQARAGAAWALSALVARYQPPVVRYLVRLTGSEARGHALAEDVLVRMAKRVRGPHGGDRLRLWLLRACTEAGLDALRHPERADPHRLGAGQGPAALIAGRVGESPVGRWMSGWGARRHPASESRQPVQTQEFVWQPSAATGGPAAESGEREPLAPREALKYRMVRAVLAELPYGDAQCLSLHLVAGLNQTEVAQALGITATVARRRIVQGLQLFGRRYDAALAGLGLAPDFEGADQTTSAAAAPLPSAPAAYAPPAVRVASTAPEMPGYADASVPPPPPAVVMPAAPVAPPVAARGDPPAQAPDTAEAADAAERALTSADIMAYLRAAAANSKSRGPVPLASETIVDAVPSSATTPPPTPEARAIAAPVAPLAAPAEPGEVALDAAPAEDPPSDEMAEPAAAATAREIETSEEVAQSEAAAVALAPAPGAAASASMDGDATPDALPPDGAREGVVDLATAESDLAVMAASARGGDLPADGVAGDASGGPSIEASGGRPVPEPRVVPVLRPQPAPEPAILAEPGIRPVAHDAEHLAAPAATSAGITSVAAGAAMDAQMDAQTDTQMDAVASQDAAPPALEPPIVAEPVVAEPVVAEPVLADGDGAAATTGTIVEDLAESLEDGADTTDHYLLVVEPDADIPAAPSDVTDHADAAPRVLRARRVHVLSADGEAEDPTDGAIWPLP